MKLPAAVCLALLALGCAPRAGPRAAREGPETLAVSVLGDTSEAGTLRPARFGAAPGARLTLVRIATARADIGAALPVPEPSAPPAHDESPTEASGDDILRPPLPRGTATLRVRADRPAWVEFDVRVDEAGEVTDVIAVAGDADPAVVRAATDAALALRWHPATRRGQPVAVWCRQRFEAGPGR
ncbi:MAG: energy transducer TonB [Candidatus Eisenbacteria bacterium]|nr:energy transducer TonB [Candidatus Eisenbacteria bacterium]